MKPFLIVKTGGTFDDFTPVRGDFEHWTARSMGLSDNEWECVNIQKGEPLPDPTWYAGCVITGSHDMVTDGTDWIKVTGDWIIRTVEAEVPLIGICFGHELMAMVLGGEAGYHPDGMEIGTVPITLTDAAGDDPLFSNLPRIFDGHVTHSQTALTLPGNAILLASSAHDAHQAFRVGQCAWGFQFHPEFDAEAIRYYVCRLEDTLEEQGRDVARILSEVKTTPESTAIMPAFVAYCRELGR